MAGAAGVGRKENSGRDGPRGPGRTAATPRGRTRSGRRDQAPPARLAPFAAMAEAVFAVDAEQRIILWNRAAEALLGVPAHKAVGRLCYRVLQGRDEFGLPVCKRACHPLRLTKGRRPVPTADLRRRTPDGRPVWLRLMYVSVSSPRRDPLVLVHILQDVTHQKALAQAVEALATSRTGPLLLARDDQRLLTPRERTVLALLAEGLSTQPIADRLGISPATAGNHIQNLLAKLGAHSRLGAVALATRRQLL